MSRYNVANQNKRARLCGRYQIKSLGFDDTYYGRLDGALQEAVSIALLNSGYPAKTGESTSVLVNGPEGQFVLTLQTPKP